MARILASDIDGTLLRSDGTISGRARQAVADVESSGRTFILVTGRPPRWLAPIRELLDHRGLAICANGGLVLDLHTNEVVQVDAFDVEAAREVLESLRQLAPDLAFGVEWADGFAHERTYPKGTRKSELARGAAQDVDDVGELFARPPVKLLGHLPRAGLEDLVPEAVAVLGERATVTWSGVGLLEISAPGVSKASALARFARDHDLGPADVIAFGDMPNDLAMLEWAGHGVAVANAHPLVLKAADEITASNDEDGVAVILERVLAGNG